MDNHGPLAMSALILDIIIIRTLVDKGILSQSEIKEKMDVTILLLEESGLVSGDDGKAVHSVLEQTLAVFSVGL
jgi:hypothetical protein